MANFLVLDTNALPVKGSLDGGFWQALIYLCGAVNITPAISEVSLDEAVNLRRVTAAGIIDDLVSAHSRLSKLTPSAATYLPSPDSLAHDFEQMLRSKFAILPLDGTLAVEAFRREARRLLPAQNGVGGRDSAIWLTLVDLVDKSHHVHFVTANSKDFGAPLLHSTLAAEVESLDGAMQLYPSANEFLTSVAPRVAAPLVSDAEIAHVFEQSIRAQLIVLTEEVESAYTADRAMASTIMVRDARANMAFDLNGRGLAPVEADVFFSDRETGPEWGRGHMRGWMTFDLATGAAERSDADFLQIDLR